MNYKLCFAIFIPAIVAAKLDDGSKTTVEYLNTAAFGDDSVGIVRWLSGTKDSDFIHFEIQAKTKGWFGIGLSPNGAMHGSDIVIMWIDPNNQGQISDRHGPTSAVNGYPDIDEQQDYEIESFWENATTTTFQIKRKMTTCDDFDWKITRDTVHLLFSYNDRKPSSPTSIEQHQQHFSKSVRLLDPDDRSRVQRILNSPDVVAYDLFTGGVEVPSDRDTLYFCRIYEAKTFAKPMHIVGYEMRIQPGNVNYVHHLMLYGCTDEIADWLNKSRECYIPGEEPFMKHCQDVFGGWAVGGQPYAYPDNMGIQYYGEKFKYLAAQIHYNNDKFVPNIVDNSSFRFYLTEKTRPTEVGKFNLGTDSDQLSHVIPPGQTNFTQYAYCPASCSNNLEENEIMYIFAGMLHSHLTGVAIRARHLRNGVELPPLIADNFYDFNYQSSIDFSNNPREFRKGDEIIVECVHDTTSRNTTTFGGDSTQEEMCLVLLEYYPRREWMEQRCMTQLDRTKTPLAMGAKDCANTIDQDKMWIIDDKGNNRSYYEWARDLKWTPTTIRSLQDYVRDNTQNVFCKITPKSANTSDVYDYYAGDHNPVIHTPLAKDNNYCSAGNERLLQPIILLASLLAFLYR